MFRATPRLTALAMDVFAVAGVAATADGVLPQLAAKPPMNRGVVANFPSEPGTSGGRHAHDLPEIGFSGNYLKERSAFDY